MVSDADLRRVRTEGGYRHEVSPDRVAETSPADAASISPPAPDPGTLAGILRGGSLTSAFQPIVDLSTGRIVGYEALARGPVGGLSQPDELFAMARADGLVAELDRACLRAAFDGAAAGGMGGPLTLFVNLEPAALEAVPSEALAAAVHRLPAGLHVVVELTERALGTDPADLLRNVERIRGLGVGIALDDVGSEPLSLAFMSLLRPDIVKLDLRMVQRRADAQVAGIMNAVNAYAERSGALILAEGIENARHLALAGALGARLGQGWLFGRPVADLLRGAPDVELQLPARCGRERPTATPFGCLGPDVALRRAPKSLLTEMSRYLEGEATHLGPAGIVAATFQRADNFTGATAERYRQIGERVGFVCVLGRGVPREPLPGVRGGDLLPGDPVCAEWDLVLLDPHFAVALLARDLGDDGPAADRTFEFALTYDRATVERAAYALVAKLDSAPLPAPGLGAAG